MEPNNQNQQPFINQLPAMAPLPPAKKPASKRYMKLIAIMVVILIGLTTLVVIRNNPTSLMTNAAAPEENTFYSATVNGKQALFFRNKEMHISGVPADPHMGWVMLFEYGGSAKHHAGDNIDFRKVENAKKLFVFERYATIENFALSEDKNYLVMSFLGGMNDKTNYIYQVNLQTAESKKVWQNEIYQGNAPYNSGVAYVTNFIPDKYVVFSLIKGEPAPVGVPGGVIAKNIQTGSERVLGVVGDTQLNESEKTVSFKKIEKVQAPCAKPKDAQCFATDTYKLVNLPSGQTITEPLP